MERSQLRDALEQEIVEGHFAPGERLDETELARRFGVSRTPVREALMHLSAIGLVTSQPRRGTVVVSPGPARLMEMFEVMGELESMAGRLAARRLNANDEAALKAAHAACTTAAENGDADAYYYENEKFHDGIYAASHNGFLTEECRVLHRRLKPYRRLQLRVANRLADSIREHGAIVEALLARDPAAAQSRLRDHVVVQGDRFADLIASLPQLHEGGLKAAAKQRS